MIVQHFSVWQNSRENVHHFSSVQNVNVNDFIDIWMIF